MPVPTSIASLSQTPASNSPQPGENVGTIMNQYIQAAYAFIAQLSNTVSTGYNPNGTLTAPSGTRVVMQQAAAPAGWTVDTSANFTDAAVRFNQGVTTGGVTGWSGFGYGNTFNTGGTAISAAQMPSHNHGINDPGHAHSASVGDGGHGHGVNDPGHNHAIIIGNIAGGNSGPGGAASQQNNSNGNNNWGNVTTSGTGISIAASGSNISVGIGGAGTGISTQANGSGQTHNHTWTTPQVKFADVIVAVKS